MNRFGGEHFRNIISSVGELLFPPLCVYCGEDHQQSDSGVCPECSKNIRLVEPPFCQRCGKPVQGLLSGTTNLCGTCLADEPPFDRARFSVYYSSVVRRGILQFKFNNSLYLGEALLGLLSETFNNNFSGQNLDAIIPVPVHPRRLIHRGYNQCAILSRKLGARFNIPAPTDVLVKTRNTVPQTRLNRKQRVENIKGSFAVKKPAEVDGKSVLVVDDVFTTGSTLSEAAITLKRHGAAVVQALVLALRYGPVEKDHPPDLQAYTDMFFTDAENRQ